MTRQMSAGLFAQVLLFTAYGTLCLAQGPQPGDPSFSPIENHGYYSIDLQNLNINVDVPIRSKMGFGTYQLAGSNYVFVVGKTFGLNRPFNNSGAVGLVGTYLTGSASTGGFCNGHPNTVWSQLAIVDSIGTYRSFPASRVDQYGCFPGGTFVANDNSGITLIVSYGISPTWTIYSAGGSHASGSGVGYGTPAASETDPNNNTVSVSNNVFTDTLGVHALSISGSGGVTNYTYPDSSGNAVTVTQTMQNTNSESPPAWNTACGTGYSGWGPIQYSFLTQVQFAVGTSQQSSLSFGYEPTPGVSGYYTGRLASITLPTRGQITFAYSGGNGSGINCDGTPGTMTRTTPDGTWTYVHTPPTPPTSINTTTVTDPLGNETDYTFSGQFLVQVQQKNSAGIVQADSFVCYNAVYTGCTAAGTAYTASVAFPITQRDTYSRYAGQTTYTVAETLYDSYGNTTDSRIYGTGAAGTAPGNLLKEVMSPVGTCTGTGCSAVGNNIQNRTCYVNVFDGSGNVKSSTAFTYDQYGNLQSTKISPSANVNSSDALISSATYNPTGTIATAHDFNNIQTTFTEGQCNSMLLTNVAAGGLSTSAAYDTSCNGGVAISSTDENGQTGTFAYADPFWRLTSATDPLNHTVNTSYGAGGTSVESTFTFNSGSSIHDTTTYNDSLGRAFNTQTKEGPSVSKWDASTIYRDADGRTQYATLPCLTTAVQGSCPQTGAKLTYIYDALSRVSSITGSADGTVTYSYTAVTVGGNNVLDTLVTGGGKSVNVETDALGRTTSVCEISSQSGSGACGQGVAKTGFLTTFAYDVLGNVLTMVQGAQTRSFTYDAMSRMLTANTPEGGLVRYFYDTAPSTPGAACSVTNGKGHLVKRYDANGNTTCYSYDSLGRTTSIVYTGPNDNGYNKYFKYDSALVNGITMAYASGRLAEAYTAQTSTGTKQTDEGFSYDQDGHLIAVYESTPNSGGYYVTTVNYFEDGTPQSLSGITSTTSNFGIDSKGRFYSESQGTTPEVSSTTYDVADHPLVVTFGSGDKDTYTWNGNTGRMKSYQFSVGATPVTDTGTLTWNANGTLKSLAIMDNLNTADTQTCNAGYDDLAHLSSYNCGTVWSQTFSYDRYGNITKSGSLMWQPGYNANTNRYTLAGTSYDANGNLLNDTFHTYTWDAENKVASIDGTKTFVYDAFAAPAEWTSGTTNRQYLHTPIGFVGTMNGQSTNQIRVPLPGGDQFMLGGNLRHNDWLGSTRLITTTSRAVIRSMAYAPFGETYAISGSTGNPSFAGLDWDDAKGTGGTSGDLYDADARELHPNQGRWISPDPAGLAAVEFSNPQTLNRYTYVGNNPLSFTDPSGLSDCIGGHFSCPVVTLDGEEFDGEFGRYLLGALLGMDAAIQCGNLCGPVSIPNAGFAFPSYAADNSINWSFSFPTVYAGVELTGAALAETLGLPTDVPGASDFRRIRIPRPGENPDPRNMLRHLLQLEFSPASIDCRNPGMNLLTDATATLVPPGIVSNYVDTKSLLARAQVGGVTSKATPVNPYSNSSWSIPFIPGFDSTIFWKVSGNALSPFYRSFTVTATQNIECQ